jgi:hypothetical protein
MTQGRSIIDLPLWLQTPAGRYLLDWERARIEAHVADVFGFHALQLGLGELDALQANRMPHRWLAFRPSAVPGDPRRAARPPVRRTARRPRGAAPGRGAVVRLRRAALPVAEPGPRRAAAHARAGADPHQTLREVERVLVPEGRLVVLGFNPTSLWGARQWSGRWARRIGLLHADARPFLPQASELIGHRRLRDWLRLLGFEVEAGGFGCYRPALRSQSLARALRLDGPARRPLVAGVRRGLPRERGQARARHAPGRAGLEEGAQAARRPAVVARRPASRRSSARARPCTTQRHDAERGVAPRGARAPLTHSPSMTLSIARPA